jgi:UPF0755 protein
VPGFDADRPAGRGRRPRRRRLRIRWLAPLISAIVLLAAVGLGGGYLYHIYQLRRANYTGDGFGSVTVYVPPGASAFSLAPQLIRKGVIKAAEPFDAAAKDSASPNGLVPGYFRLHKHMNALLAWKLLLNPKSMIQVTATVVDGQRLARILASLSNSTGIPLRQLKQAAADTKALGLPSYANGNPEGYLYPATYSFPPHPTALSIVQALVRRFKQEAASLSLAKAAKAVNLTQGQVITVASLLEAEGGKPKYYSSVAEVIYNRLNAHPPMKLQLDSTVLYALGKTGFRITPSQQRVRSRYNTFLHPGLPPGPIDNPDQAAILAALHPLHGKWLYFVTVDPKTGLTKFTSSAAAFQRLVARCRSNGAC